MQAANSPKFDCQHQHGLGNWGTNKRLRDEEDALQHRFKSRRFSNPLSPLGASCQSSTKEPTGQLLCPSSHPEDPIARTHTTDQPECFPPAQQIDSLFEISQPGTKLQWWLSNLASSEDFENREIPEVVNGMNRPISKRPRSSNPLESPPQSGDGLSNSSATETKYSAYKDVGYPVILETSGSFMRASKSGMAEEDKELCERLLTTSQPIVSDPLFGDDLFDEFHSNLCGRSEARILLDLHPRLVPSVENLYICGRGEFAGLIEGYNDPWYRSIPFCGPRPQPDHTYGFRWSNFTEQQRCKLMIDQTEKSLYKAREDIYFPFLTAEIKCGTQGLDLADRPNAHSMTIQMRGIVNLYRKINRPKDVQRRVLGFSISHNDQMARIYAHYPEIDGDKTTYWRQKLTDFNFGNDHGKDRWTSYRFTLNVCQFFALPLVERLKDVINELPDPCAQSFRLAVPVDNISMPDSQDDPSIAESQTRNSKKPRYAQGLNAESRNLIQTLERQLDQQQRETKEREKLLRAQLEQQQRTSEQQLKQLLEMLKEQRESWSSVSRAPSHNPGLS